MKLLLGIATYKRIEKLQRLLDSLGIQTYTNFEVVIVCDNKDFETHEYLRNNRYPFRLRDIITLADQGFVIKCWNTAVQTYMEDTPRDGHLVPINYDGFVGLVDDVELYEDTLENAVRCFKEVYNKSTDGVVGFNQECPGHQNYTFKWFGQTLMGRQFIERYKDVKYQICCPMYRWSHQDEEMHEYASSLGKFHQCRYAILKHYHPSFIKEEIDETHSELRYGSNSPKEHDLKLFNERTKLGLLWPLS